MLTHAERQELIAEIARFSVRYIPPKTHAGTLILRELPTEGRASKRGRGDGPDDSYYHEANLMEDILSGWDDELEAK